MIDRQGTSSDQAKVHRRRGSGSLLHNTQLPSKESALVCVLSLTTFIHKAIRQEDMMSRHSDTALYWSIYYTHLYAHMRHCPLN